MFVPLHLIGSLSFRSAVMSAVVQYHIYLFQIKFLFFKSLVSIGKRIDNIGFFQALEKSFSIALHIHIQTPTVMLKAKKQNLPYNFAKNFVIGFVPKSIFNKVNLSKYSSRHISLLNKKVWKNFLGRFTFLSNNLCWNNGDLKEI